MWHAGPFTTQSGLPQSIHGCRGTKNQALRWCIQQVAASLHPHQPQCSYSRSMNKVTVVTEMKAVPEPNSWAPSQQSWSSPGLNSQPAMSGSQLGLYSVPHFRLSISHLVLSCLHGNPFTWKWQRFISTGITHILGVGWSFLTEYLGLH